MSKSFLYTDGLFMSAMRNVWASENNNDFLGGDVIRNKKRIFPVVVAATMSSGTSTLINALLGNDILPMLRFPIPIGIGGHFGDRKPLQERLKLNAEKRKQLI